MGRWPVAKFVAFFLVLALWVGGCATMGGDPETARMPKGAGFASGWTGIEVAYHMHGLSASHTIVAVMEGSPAGRAGVMVGDQIGFVGPDNAGYMTTQEVARRLSQAGPQVVLKVKRAGQKELLAFVLNQAETSAAGRPAPPPDAAAGGRAAQAVAPPKSAAIDAPADDIPLYATDWGFKGSYAENGFRVTQVAPRSAAEEAGLKIGDVILAVNGAALNGSSDFARPPYVPVQLHLRREGAEFERTILPRGILKLGLSELGRTFTIPGVPAHETPGTVSAVDALDCINVLDRVVLDPPSGQIAIVGHYDPAYDTGKIPYLDLLKTALANPAPILNLVPTAETEKEMIAAGTTIRSNLPLMVDAVRGHPDFERERQLMIRELSKACGLTPAEYVDWYNYVKLDSKKDVLPPPPIGAIQFKVFAYLGYTEVARALELTFANTPAAAVEALQVLGHGDEARALLASHVADGDGGRGALMAEAYLAMAQSSGIVTAEALEPLRNWYREKKITGEVVIRNVQNLLMPYTPKHQKDTNLMVEAFTRIYLSPQAVQFLEGLPTPYAAPVPIDLDGNSQLARIMYEADYGLKSLSVMPELFQHIPGSLSRNEYQRTHGLLGKGELYYRQWLEPKMVDMKVAPDRRVIDFTFSQMRYLFADDSEYWKKPPKKGLAQGFGAWCDHFMDHYDAYAAVVPAFHKVREAAKVLALAQWALAEKMPLDLSGVVQEKWDTPAKVSAYWVLSQGIYSDGLMGTSRNFEGGVSFKTRGSWTQVTPSITTTTEASAQLSLSAALGQRAAQVAAAGDLEEARHLAELSAQAMTGGVPRGELARLNLAMPEARPAPVSPAGVRLQQEMVKATHGQIVALAGNPGAQGPAREALSQIGQLYGQLQDHPAAASDYLKQLQTGRLTPPSAAASPSAPSPPSTAAPSAAWAPCSDPALQDPTLPITPQRRAFLNDRLFEARERLKYIQIALKNLIRLNEGQRAEIEKVTRDISQAYDASVDRAWSVVFDLLTSLPADKFLENYSVAKARLDDAMAHRTGLLTTPLEAGAQQRIQAEIRRIRMGQDRLAEIYEGSKRLLDVFKGANYAYEIDQWNEQTQEDYGKVQDAALMIGQLMLDYPKLEDYLKTKAFFAGEKYYQVLAMGRMAYYGTGFFLDILAQKLAWEPLSGQLSSDLKNNAQAMDQLREKAAVLYREIGCIENALR